MIDESCKKCVYYNPYTKIGCDFKDTVVRCSLLKDYEKKMKIKGE
jgi:hypothetical protein